MKKKDLITLLAGVAVIIFLAIFFMRGDQLQHLIQTIERGTPVFLLAGLVFQLGKYFTQGLSFTWCFKAAGTSMPIGETVTYVWPDLLHGHDHSLVQHLGNFRSH